MYNQITKAINDLGKGISDNYTSMLSTCDAMIKRGYDVRYWIDMKLRIIEQKAQVDKSKIIDHE